MMDLELVATRTNGAVDELIARIASLTRTNTQPLFVTCARGAILSMENVEILRKTLPACRVWYDRNTYHMGVNDFVVAGDVGGSSGIHKKLDIHCYLYSFDRDSSGEPIDLQKDLDEIEWTIIRGLQDSTDIAGYFAHSPWWGFTRPQIVDVQYGAVLRKFGGTHTLPPPWYTVTISVEIEVYPYQ